MVRGMPVKMTVVFGKLFTDRLTVLMGTFTGTHTALTSCGGPSRSGYHQSARSGVPGDRAVQ